ncbi:MAG: polysaccharide biosynthesis protein, partial [Leptospira sp.]|nr:polysaccharide biosynthesis protein [Leptospira sp.]
MYHVLHRFSGYAKTFYHSRFFRTSSLIGVSKIFSSLCNLIFMVYAVNILSKSENGQLQYYLGFLPVILAVAEFG